MPDWTELLTEAEREAEKRHFEGMTGSICNQCSEGWPCVTKGAYRSLAASRALVAEQRKALHGVEIPLKFTYKPRTTAPNPVPPTPIEIADVLIEALKTTAIIHNQSKDGLLAMQIALTEATEKAISEIFHIVRQANGQDVSHL